MSSAELIFQDYIVEVDGERRLEVNDNGRTRTVELREPLPFESDLVADLSQPSIDSSISGNARPIKGKWIHGWLRENQDDYINSIYKNYQFFLKYLEARTANIDNISTHKRSAGSYDSMYRYILLLEDIGLIDRYRREEVPPDAYDFNVPDEFRTRTYVKLEEGYEGNEDKWNNPYEAAYPGGKKEEPDDSGMASIDVEPGPEPEQEPEPEPEGGPTGLGGFVPEGQPEGEVPDVPDQESEEEQEEPKGIDEIADETFGAESLPDDGASIGDFPNKDQLLNLIKKNFLDALELTFEDAPVPTQTLDEDDFSIGRVGVFGPWAEGEATPGETGLSLIVSVDDTDAERSPTFVATGVQTQLESILNRENPFGDTFPSYEVVGVFNSAFTNKLRSAVRQTQDENIYYNLTDQETVSL